MLRVVTPVQGVFVFAGQAAWEGLFPNSDLLQCVEEGAIGIDDFYHAGTSMISAYKQYESDNHSGAESDLDAGLHSLKSGLGEFEQMLGNCKELAGLAERVGGIVADLDNVIGEVGLVVVSACAVWPRCVCSFSWS